MSPAPSGPRSRAVLMLLLANGLWGLSFPLIKAVTLLHAELVPAAGTWFSAVYTVAPRFILAVIVLREEGQRAKALDYDFMKTYVRFPDYLQKRFTEYSHQLGIPVSSHEIYPAVSYGVDAIEHVGATSRRGYSPVRSNIGRSYQDVTGLITAARLKVTPTAALYGGFNMLTATDPNLLQNKQYVALYSDLYRTTYEAFVKSAQADLASEKAMLEGWTITFRKLLAAGNHFTAGTDAPFMPYGLSIQIEIQTYVEVLGMSPFTALQSATIWAAESVGVDKELGSLEPGKLADLVIVSGDPLKNIKDALNVKTVIKNGFVFPIDELLTKPVAK